MCVPLPPHEEQTAVVEQLEYASNALRIFDPSALMARLGVLGQAILAKAFRGELAPQDLNDEPADAMLARVRAANVAAGQAESQSKRRTQGEKRARA
jgi:type I restriction enzyme S subunit